MTSKVSTTLAARRAKKAKRAQSVQCFQPETLADIVGTVGGDDGAHTHIAMKPPPAGCTWAFSPEQARELAKLLSGHADLVDVGVTSAH